ncbi:hypothetical protein [Lacibacter sediminis]|uniref:Outer membrane protein beta-barrel domain-containing protein n=1 Tax=Lacibacter sediminis TaxID=2760713 RepID=A0A7G5XHV9_9BACT|nr:hypothetical protein [Lacibacter sediminis]QNA45062.1 hypothetical protein H4075_02365 [Lacibacter sediminis]
MPGDDLYKKLNEPAPDAFPKFEEESWRKMEVLLDKHLPENNGKPFPYILLLSCVILASLTTFLPARRASQPGEGITSSTKSLIAKPVSSIVKTEVQSPSVAVEEKNDRSTDLEIQTKKISTTEIVKIEPNRKTAALFQTEKDELKQKEFVINAAPEVTAEVSLTQTGKAVSLSNWNNFLLLTNEPAKNNRSLVVTNEKNSAIRKPVKNNFSFTFSAGLETPGTSFNTLGRLTPVVGIGVMYSIGEKIILRTGVASASKIYAAHDKDYNPANNYWASYTYFKKIDADCKVIEIPLGIAYRVVNGKKTNVYVSAGSSSVIMRKEAYNYYYKNQAGRDTVTHRAWNNNSFHLFSSVNFSAIAERKLSNRFSLMAEPGIKIPSGGIGVGKIRLYNAGLTVTAKFKLR